MINCTAIIDTREQRPVTLEFKKGLVMQSEPGTLYTGDYSLKGFENLVAIERKSVDDLMGCIGTHRERFEREIIRLKGYEVKAIVVESTLLKSARGDYRSRVNTSAAIGTLMGWIAEGIPIVMADNHKRAGVFIARMLYITARRYKLRLKGLS